MLFLGDFYSTQLITKDIHYCSVDKVFAFIQRSYFFVYFWQT